MLEGELVLVEDDGETILKPGDCAGFKANVANGHHLVNRSDRDAVYLEIGTRSHAERVTIRMSIMHRDARRERQSASRTRSGEPY